MPNQHREDEKRRREAAQAHTAEVEPGGHEVAGRSIRQMVSVRLEAQLLKDLRELAETRGESVSDLLREAAVELVARSRRAPLRLHFRQFGTPPPVITELMACREVTSGVSAPREDTQPVSC